MGNMTSYKRPDGQSVSGYLAEPAKGAAAPGMVVIQELVGSERPDQGRRG